jgi:hypothetical protein
MMTQRKTDSTLPAPEDLERMTKGTSLQVRLAHEGSALSLQLLNRLTKADRDTRSILRAVFLAAVFFLLSVAALAYCALLQPEIFYDSAHFFIKILSFVCLTSLIAEVEFLGCRLSHRIVVNRLHQECRRLLSDSN